MIRDFIMNQVLGMKWLNTLIGKLLGSNNPFGVILATIIGIPMYADILERYLLQKHYL